MGVPLSGIGAHWRNPVRRRIIIPKSHAFYRPAKIVSGGQTGVDRAALDAAIALGIPHGGWCPRGRLAEDGPIPERYRMQETDSPEYPVRTERNVVESDATLLVYQGRMSGGTRLTYRLARRHRRPRLAIDLDSSPSLASIHAWLASHHPQVLNIAGPRESQNPGIAARTLEFLKGLWETRE